MFRAAQASQSDFARRHAPKYPFPGSAWHSAGETPALQERPVNVNVWNRSNSQ
jgi:hypothetical protein